MKFTFNKTERLKSRKVISLLFSNGKVISEYPIRLIWLADQSSEKGLIKFGFAVSKKSFKRAVDRNRIKRLMRESVRLNKHVLTEITNFAETNLSILLLYNGKNISKYNEIESKVIACFNRLIDVKK